MDEIVHIYDPRLDTLHGTVNDAISAIQEASKSNGRPILFRGQRMDWAVSSSINRIDKKAEREEESIVTFRFIDWYRENKNIPQYPNDDYGMLLPYYAIAQHYGYKTDLIDFSRDLDVAKGFSLLNKNPRDKGVIIVLWERDLDYLRSSYEKIAPQIPDEARKALEKNDFLPFFEFDTIGVSRIHNQRGVFLWDVCNIATQLLTKMPRQNMFFFNQTELSIDMSFTRFLYPAVNYTELEIESYNRKKYADHFLRDYVEWHKAIENKLYGVDRSLSGHFEKNTLEQMHYSVDGLETFPQSVKEIKIKPMGAEELTKLLSPSGALDFVYEWFSAKENERYLMCKGEGTPNCRLFAEVINDILVSLSRYSLYNKHIISTVLCESVNLLNSLFNLSLKNSSSNLSNVLKELDDFMGDLTQLEDIFDKLRETVPIEDLSEECWNEKSLFIRYSTEEGVVSWGVLPLCWINNCSKDYKAKHLSVLKTLFADGSLPAMKAYLDADGKIKSRLIREDELRWEVMLSSGVTDPCILFDTQDLYTAFITRFLPWQFVMCPQRNRIYAPDKIVEICAANGQRLENTKTYYYKGGYITNA